MPLTTILNSNVPCIRLTGDIDMPVCFALVDGFVVSAVDHKPKRTGQLRRLDDMRGSGTATVLVDHYEEDWSQLWWVRVRGRAEVLAQDQVGVRRAHPPDPLQDLPSGLDGEVDQDVA